MDKYLVKRPREDGTSPKKEKVKVKLFYFRKQMIRIKSLSTIALPIFLILKNLYLV